VEAFVTVVRGKKKKARTPKEVRTHQDDINRNHSNHLGHGKGNSVGAAAGRKKSHCSAENRIGASESNCVHITHQPHPACASHRPHVHHTHHWGGHTPSHARNCYGHTQGGRVSAAHGVRAQDKPDWPQLGPSLPTAAVSHPAELLRTLSVLHAVGKDSEHATWLAAQLRDLADELAPIQARRTVGGAWLGHAYPIGCDSHSADCLGVLDPFASMRWDWDELAAARGCLDREEVLSAHTDGPREGETADADGLEIPVDCLSWDEPCCCLEAEWAARVATQTAELCLSPQ
jgi:hypothetical protein